MLFRSRGCSPSPRRASAARRTRCPPGGTRTAPSAGHYGEFTEIREETCRIIDEYETRCTQLRLALAESRRPMTLLELDQALYVQRMQAYRYSYLFSYLNTWPKLFSCLDWLAETGAITRTEKDGILFWSLR